LVEPNSPQTRAFDARREVSSRSSGVNERQRTSTTASATGIPFPRLAPVGRASTAWVVALLRCKFLPALRTAGQLSALTARRGTPSSERCSSRGGRGCALAARPERKPDVRVGQGGMRLVNRGPWCESGCLRSRRTRKRPR
jgi:hypothetical protein